jgi:hypothetical protein
MFRDVEKVPLLWRTELLIPAVEIEIGGETCSAEILEFLESSSKISSLP